MSVDYWVGQSHLPPRNQTSISEIRLKDYEAFFAKNQKVQIRAKRGLCGKFQYGDGQPAFDAAINDDYLEIATINATPTGVDIVGNTGFDYQHDYDYFYAVPVDSGGSIQWEWHTSSSSSSWQIYPYFYMTQVGLPMLMGYTSVLHCGTSRPPIFHYVYDRPGWSENLWPIKEDTDYITAKHLDDLVAAMQHIDAGFVPRQTHGFVNNLREMENFLDAITIEPEPSFEAFVNTANPPIYARQHRGWWSGSFPTILLNDPDGNAWVWNNIAYWGAWMPACIQSCATGLGCWYASYPLYDLSVQNAYPGPQPWIPDNTFPGRGEWDKTALGAARINLIRNVIDHLRIEALTGEGFRKAIGGDCAGFSVVPDDGVVRTGFWTGPCESTSSVSSPSSLSSSPSSISISESLSSFSPESPSSLSPSSLSPSSLSPSSLSPSSFSSSPSSLSPSSLGETSVSSPSEESASTASSPSSISVSESSPSSISVSESSPSSASLSSVSSISVSESSLSPSSAGFSPSSASPSSASESPSSAGFSPSSASPSSASESPSSLGFSPSSESGICINDKWYCVRVDRYTDSGCTNFDTSFLECVLCQNINPNCHARIPGPYAKDVIISGPYDSLAACTASPCP